MRDTSVMVASFVPRLLALALLIVVPLVCARRERTSHKPVGLLATALFTFHALTLGPLARGHGVALVASVLGVAACVVAVIVRPYSRIDWKAHFSRPSLYAVGLTLVVLLVFSGARSLAALAVLAPDPEARFRIDVLLSGASPASMRRLAFARLEAGEPSKGIDLVLRAAALDAEELTHLASFAEASALSGDCDAARRALDVLRRDARRVEPFARHVVDGYVRDAKSLCAHAL